MFGSDIRMGRSPYPDHCSHESAPRWHENADARRSMVLAGNRNSSRAMRAERRTWGGPVGARRCDHPGAAHAARRCEPPRRRRPRTLVASVTAAALRAASPNDIVAPRCRGRASAVFRTWVAVSSTESATRTRYGAAATMPVASVVLQFEVATGSPSRSRRVMSSSSRKRTSHSSYASSRARRSRSMSPSSARRSSAVRAARVRQSAVRRSSSSLASLVHVRCAAVNARCSAMMADHLDLAAAEHRHVLGDQVRHRAPSEPRQDLGGRAEHEARPLPGRLHPARGERALDRADDLVVGR